MKHWTVPRLQKVFTSYIAKELSGNSTIATPVGSLLKKVIMMPLNMLKFDLILSLSLFISCNYNSNVEEKSQSLKKKETVFINISKEVKSIGKDIFTLKVKSKFSTDTLDVLDYRETNFSSPIILEQHLVFSKNGKVIKMHKIPIEIIRKKTITNYYLDVLKTPIYEVGLFNSEDNIPYYVILGADYCNGADCKEFIGVYSLLGKIICEEIPNKKNTILNQVFNRYKFNINNRTQIIAINL